MKTLLIWIALTAMSCTAFSQNLIPILQQENNDTLFCFTLNQCRTIAKHLEHGRYCDSLLSATEIENEQLGHLQAWSDSTLQAAAQMSSNQQLVIANQQQLVASINLNLEQVEKKYKIERWQKRLFVLTTVVFSGWLVKYQLKNK